jgi:hypothetical protein
MQPQEKTGWDPGVSNRQRYVALHGRNPGDSTLDVAGAMARLGFHHVHTGGGCTAYEKLMDGKDPDSGYIMITVANDADAPQYFDDDIMVGLYANGGCSGRLMQKGLTLREWLRFTSGDSYRIGEPQTHVLEEELPKPQRRFKVGNIVTTIGSTAAYYNDQIDLPAGLRARVTGVESECLWVAFDAPIEALRTSSGDVDEFMIDLIHDRAHNHFTHATQGEQQ